MRSGSSDVDRLHLPNLLIAGVTKAGTTSLFHYLRQHPDITASHTKEIDHFAPLMYGEQPPPLTAYRAHFAEARPTAYRLEASPRYFIGGAPVIDAIRDALPAPKVILLLRDPVARMWSSYTFKQSKGRLPAGMDFAAFFEACRQVATVDLVRRPQNANFAPLATGVYSWFLPEWLAAFGADVRVVFAEDLRARPADTVMQLCDWLSVARAPVGSFDFEVRNATYTPRSMALRRLAAILSRHANRALGAQSGVVERMKSVYYRANATPVEERFTSADRDMVGRFYADTLPPLRRQLTDAGYDAFPSWLHDADQYAAEGEETTP